MGTIKSRARQLRLNLQALRGESISLYYVAEQTGLSRKTLTQIELGKTTNIDFSTLARLCEFYGVGVCDVLEYEPDPSEKKRAPHPVARLASAY